MFEDMCDLVATYNSLKAKYDVKLFQLHVIWEPVFKS